jgi:hypothetical protein
MEQGIVAQRCSNAALSAYERTISKRKLFTATERRRYNKTTPNSSVA